MIFNLFKSKNNWQHKDSNVRIAAVNEELSIEINDDKVVLLSLLNEDSSELVRRAVLLKLNDFNHYRDASLLNDNISVQEFAALQVQNILSGNHSVTLSNNEKLNFLSKIKNNTNKAKEPTLETALLSHWLEHENDPSLVLSLFNLLAQKKNTTQFLLQVFTKKQSAEIQKQLLSLELVELNESSLLTKLSKRAVSGEINQIINNRLADLIEQKEKPKKLFKQKQLVLSKLLALKDQTDYAHYRVNKTALEKEWHQDLTEIKCLSEDEQQTLLEKFNKITSQLTEIFAPKEEAYQQEIISEKLFNAKKIAKTEFNKTITELNQIITTAVFEGDWEGDWQGTPDNTKANLVNQQDFSTKLNQLNDSITTSVLNETEQDELLQKSSQLAQRLTQLPEIAKSVSDATHLISKISQLTLPQSLSELNDRQQTYTNWLNDYKSVNKKAQGVLPQSIIDAYKEITHVWQNGLKPLQQEQKKLFDQTKKKLIDLKRLLINGKYKVCFGLFKGVTQAISLLSVHQQQQLQRDFEHVSEKMAEVSDWEHYIATPRKQELLIEINNLVTTPLDDPNAQADKVKQYRKKWNSLGHADEAIDKELNEQFNLACEQAFAPCRLFYAEQEKIRAVHLVTRNEILIQAEKLAELIKLADIENSSIDFKSLDGKLNKLQQRWQQAGEVDRQEYQKLFKQFKNLIAPVKNAIKGFHDTNCNEKQALIVKAEQQLAVDDIYQAVETIKKLQNQWRDVGFAGSHQESKLWQKFRSINDQVFARREQAKSEQQTKQAQFIEEFNHTLSLIQASVVETNDTKMDKASLLIAKDKAEALLSLVVTNKPVIKSVASGIELFIKQLNSQIKHLHLEQESKSWQSLFKLLDKMVEGEVVLSADNITDEVEYLNLTSFWQKRLTEQCLIKNKASPDERANKTLALEILAQVESPIEFASQRMAVQVGLMQEQMQSADNIDLSHSFVEWLRLGKLETSDSILLARVKPIFCHNKN